MGTRTRAGALKKRPPVPSWVHTVAYPSGCEEVSHDMNDDELIGRLKMLSKSFQTMNQLACENFIPLCLHLIGKEFLNHPNKYVKIQIALILADILRVYAPSAPYKGKGQIRAICMFLIQQLEGLKEQSDPNFKRYFYLLENLACLKSFKLCFQLDDASEILLNLFEMIFQIASDLEHPGKIMSCMLDLLGPILQECDAISDEVLNIILINILEPIKSKKTTAYSLAKVLIANCEAVLLPYIQIFFQQVLIRGENLEGIFIAKKAYDLIYELYKICPAIISAVFPQLELKLRSLDRDERLASTSVLAILFSEENSVLAVQHAGVWQSFLGRFNDIDVSIRLKCVQYSMHFLLKHPELRDEIVKALKPRHHDPDGGIRLEVVKSIVATAKFDFSIVSESEDVLNDLMERTLDKSFKIRKEALQGLAHIYKAHVGAPDLRDTTKRAATLIKNQILHNYYMTSPEDRVLIERCLNTCLVPYQLDCEERMKKLMYLFGTIDEPATKAFVEIQKTFLIVRHNVAQMLKYVREMNAVPGMERHLNIRISQLSKLLPDPIRASEYLSKFSVALQESPILSEALEIIVDDNTDCQTSVGKTNFLLKKLGPATATNSYYKSIQILLERTSSVLIDKVAIRKLLDLLSQIIGGNWQLLRALGMDSATAIERGFRLIKILCFGFPRMFCEVDIIQRLIQLLNLVSEEQHPFILTTLNFIGKQKPIGKYEEHPNLIHDLQIECEKMVISGSPKVAKEAIRCIFTNMNEAEMGQSLTQCMHVIKSNLNHTDERYRTSIVALGHIALQAPAELCSILKSVVANKIVKELLVNPSRTSEDRYKGEGPWCEKSELPEITLCMMEGMKATYRWLVGVKTDQRSTASKTFKLLTAIIEAGGVFGSDIVVSDAEKSWLRLTAGCCMLKICEHAGVGDHYSALQFCGLSKLMIDDVLEVRRRFALKLHRGLARGIPNKCLPLHFMGFFALAGYEADQKLKATIKDYVSHNVSARRDYITSFLQAASENASAQLPHIMPDYMLAFSVAVLAHNPNYNSLSDHQELSLIKECLWFILEPLILKNVSYSFGFYKALIERMKNHRDAMMPNCDVSNNKMYAICDIAFGLILQRSTHFEMGNFSTVQPELPPLFFKLQDKNFVNKGVFIPAEISYTESNKVGITFQMISPTTKKSKKRGRPSTLIAVPHGSISTTTDAETKTIIKKIRTH